MHVIVLIFGEFQAPSLSENEMIQARIRRRVFVQAVNATAAT